MERKGRPMGGVFCCRVKGSDQKMSRHRHHVSKCVCAVSGCLRTVIDRYMSLQFHFVTPASLVNQVILCYT